MANAPTSAHQTGGHTTLKGKTMAEKPLMPCREARDEAVTAMLVKWPWYGHFISALNVVETDQVPIAACGWNPKTGQGTMYFHPENFPRFDMRTRVFAIAHEVTHYTNMHIMSNFHGPLVNIAMDMACFKAGELIPTMDGHKPIDELLVGEQTLHGGKVLTVMSRPYDGLMYTVKALGCLPTTATDEHPFKVVTVRRKSVKGGRRNGAWDFENPSESWVGAAELKPNPKGASRKSFLAIPRLPASPIPDRLDLDPFMADTGHGGKPSNVKPAVREGLQLTTEMAWAMGLYVAEGSRVSQDGGLQLGLNSNEVELAAKAQAVFSALGYSAQVVPHNQRESVVNITVPSTVLGRAFSEWFGSSCETKHIPNWLIQHPDPGILEAFIQGYFDGDGTQLNPERGNARSSWTKSEALARQLQLLVARLGRLLTVRFVQRDNAGRKIEGRVIKSAQEGFEVVDRIPAQKSRHLNGQTVVSYNNHWRATPDYVLVPIQEVTSEHYTGTVYNIETEVHEYLASNLVVHNCNSLLKEMNLVPTHPEEFIYVEKVWHEYAALEPGLKQPPEKQSWEWYFNWLLDRKKNMDNKMEQILKKLGMEAPTPGMEQGVAPGLEDMIDSHEIFQDLSEQEKELVKQYVNAQAERTSQSARPPGTIAGMLEDLAEACKGKVDWRRYLKNWTGTTGALDISTTRSRHNKYGSFPRVVLKPRARILVAQDTSGSVPQNELGQFWGEIESMKKTMNLDVWVMQVDAEVHSCEPFKLRPNHQYDVKGRGGTDMRKICSYLDKHPEIGHFDGVIVMTDGWTPYPEPKDLKGRRYLWCVTEKDQVSGVPKGIGPAIHLDANQKRGE